MKQAAAIKRMPLVALCLGFFMVIIDATVVNVALPSLVKDINAGVAGLQWVVDGYTLTFACLLLSAGNLADRAGAKTVFLWGLILFVLTSLGCGLAATSWLLIAWRLLQGVGAALVVPTSLALISSLNLLHNLTSQILMQKINLIVLFQFAFKFTI